MTARRSRLTREQIVNLRSGQHVLVVEGACGIWGTITKTFVPANGERVFRIETHRGDRWVGIEPIAEIGRQHHHQ